MTLKRVSVLLLTLSLLCLLLGGAFWGFERIALDPAVYDRLQRQINRYDYIGLSPEAQSRVNRVLSDYLSGARQDVDIEETLLGVPQQVFNADEKAHMTDVYHLFVLERRIRSFCLAAGAVLTAAVGALARNRPGQTVRSALKAFLAFTAVLAAALAILSMSCGFDRLFILFHKLLFTNDLWLMNPATDAMIRMFPSEFFLRIAIESGVSALIYGLAITAAAPALLLAAGFIRTRSGRKQTP